MLKVSNITKRYGDVLVLDRVSFVLNVGERVGLIGPNGCGKSTLLRIIVGQEAADAGGLLCDPPDLRLGYLEQGRDTAADVTVGAALGLRDTALEAAEAEVERLAQAMAAAAGEALTRLLDAYGETLAELESLAATRPAAHEIEAVLAGLGLADVALETPVAILSGGQKTRLGLAGLLLQRLQVLLLDEPTNHLDIAALEWLEAWLQRYPGAVLIVSHDRAFLDNMVTRVLDLDPLTHTLTEYVGNYTAYLETWERQREKQWSQWRDQQEEVRRIRQDIHRTAMHAMSVELTTKPSQSTIRRYAKKVAKKAQSREKKLERYLESDERIEKPELTWQLKLEFVETPQSGQEVLRLEGVSVGYDGVPLLSGVEATLGAGERVALIGANGAGKTTLLRAILGQLVPLAGRVHLGANVRLGYYAQEQETLDSQSTPFAVVRAVATISDTEVRSFLHYFLFSGDAVFTPVGSLSCGERARLVLARLVATGCNFLVLDEPINHLDIPSRTQFEQAMTAFPGTVLAVVHDRYFIERFATRIWLLESGALRSYLDLEDLRRVRQQQ